jgi:hypothetical protein
MISIEHRASNIEHCPSISMTTQQLDEQLRQYQDLAKRAADLRSYL